MSSSVVIGGEYRIEAVGCKAANPKKRNRAGLPAGRPGKRAGKPGPQTKQTGQFALPGLLVSRRG